MPRSVHHVRLVQIQAFHSPQPIDDATSCRSHDGGVLVGRWFRHCVTASAKRRASSNSAMRAVDSDPRRSRRRALSMVARSSQLITQAFGKPSRWSSATSEGMPRTVVVTIATVARARTPLRSLREAMTTGRSLSICASHTSPRSVGRATYSAESRRSSIATRSSALKSSSSPSGTAAYPAKYRASRSASLWRVRYSRAASWSQRLRGTPRRFRSISMPRHSSVGNEVLVRVVVERFTRKVLRK